MPLTIIRPLCLEHEKDIAEYAMLRSYAKQEKHALTNVRPTAHR